MESANATRTRIRSYRLDLNLIEQLRKAASKEGISENNFVTGILQRRTRIDPLIPAFKGIILSDEILRAIISTSNADTLELSGFNLGKETFMLARELFRSHEMELTFTELLIDILDDQLRWFNVEGNLTEKSEGVTIRHAYGVKWSVFVKSFLIGAHTVVSKEILEVEAKSGILRI